MSSFDFYEGLKKKQAEAKTEAASHFEKALDNPNIHIAAAAVAELMSLHYSGTAIPAATINRLRKNAPAMIASKASGSWAMALDALGTGQEGSSPDREKVLALALNNGSRSPDEAIQYLLMELRITNALGGLVNADVNEAGTAPANNSMFSSAENAAIAGRIAVSHSRYREALIFFRMVMADAPDLFFQYPELLGDLGRTFQYTTTASPMATGKEGIDLFLQWEKELGENADKLIRFRLLFYAARIARQRSLPETVELFERALLHALTLPQEIRSGASNRSEQIDACIWYILNTSLPKDLSRTIKYLETYISCWQDDGYYSDVMDKLARELLLKRRWTDLINIAALVKNRPGVIGAKFPWIIGRVIQAGLLSQRDIGYALKMSGAAQEVSGDPVDVAQAYIRIAYNNAPVIDGKALYYRSLAASALGEPFLLLPTVTPLPETATQPVANAKSAEISDPAVMEFLLGFFKTGAEKFAPRYIRMMESDLSPEELFLLAEELGNGALNGVRQYQESMRLASIAVKRVYEPEKKYLELLYPRPFAAKVNEYAQETGIGPAKLFALIRAESAFNPDAISRSGAIGLTQLMPATAEEMAARILRRGGPDYTRRSDKESAVAADGDISGLIASEAGSDSVGLDLLDPGANIHMGAVYLAWLEQRMGDPLLAILAYNGGMNRVRRWRNSMPAKFPPDLFLETVEYAETMEYGRAVIGAEAMYRELD